MKMIAIAAAGLIAAGTFAAAPADAQSRYGYNSHRGYHAPARRYYRPAYRGTRYRYYSPRYRGYRWGYRPGYRARYGYRSGYRYAPRSFVRCRVVRGYYGPTRRCFRVYR